MIDNSATLISVAAARINSSLVQKSVSHDARDPIHSEALQSST